MPFAKSRAVDVTTCTPLPGQGRHRLEAAQTSGEALAPGSPWRDRGGVFWEQLKYQKACDRESLAAHRSMSGQDERERLRLRRAANGPCKQSCLLFADMAFKAHRMQVQENLESARTNARAKFYADARLNTMDDTTYRGAQQSFEDQLDATLADQAKRFHSQSKEYGVDNVKRCMAGCISLRDGPRIDEFCACIESAGDFHIAAQCFKGVPNPTAGAAVVDSYRLGS